MQQKSPCKYGTPAPITVVQPVLYCDVLSLAKMSVRLFSCYYTPYYKELGDFWGYVCNKTLITQKLTIFQYSYVIVYVIRPLLHRLITQTDPADPGFKHNLIFFFLVVQQHYDRITPPPQIQTQTQTVTPQKAVFSPRPKAAPPSTLGHSPPTFKEKPNLSDWTVVCTPPD